MRGRPVRLRFDALEFWEKPKILCATASRDSSSAAELSIALGEARVAAGFSPDIKPFRAHLTLARKISAAQAATVPWPLPLEPPMVVRCDQFVLMESRRDDAGSIYSAVDSWPLYATERFEYSVFRIEIRCVFIQEPVLNFFHQNSLASQRGFRDG